MIMHYHRRTIVAMALFIAFLFSAVTVFAENGGQVYLFSYFTGNGEDGLHFAYSEDGMTWKALGGGRSYLAPEVGNQKLMRDPCIHRGPDGVFHMVWTVSWGDTVIGYSSSRDLINWAPQRTIPVMAHEPAARNCWAPELFYDADNALWHIFWATTIPGRFPETAGSSESDYNHRIYGTSTSDFKSFTPTRVFYEPGFNVIDATIVRDDSRHVMFLKDETLDPPQKNIRIATADSAGGPYGAASEPITGDYWAEGPTAVKIGDWWIVYFDKYRKGAFGAVRSRDLENWEDISDRISFPEGIRHGTVFTVERAIFDRLAAEQ